MKELLILIRNGAFAYVVDYDKNQNLVKSQLRFNPVSHRFYLSRDERGYVRRVITRKEALKKLQQTFIIKDSYEK